MSLLKSKDFWLVTTLAVVLSILSITGAFAQTFMSASTHPNFDNATRQWLGAEQDCSVIAFAIACDVPYHKSFAAHYNYAGRKDPTVGVKVDLLLNGWNDMLMSVHRGAYYYDPTDGMTVSDFALANDKGRFFLIVPGHALAVVDGTVWDHPENQAMDAKILGIILITDSARN